MEIRQVLRGDHAAISPSRPAKSARDSGAQAARPAADRLELSQQCVQTMEEQRARIQAAVLTGADQEEKSNGILDMLDQPSAEEEQLDAMAEYAVHEEGTQGNSYRRSPKEELLDYLRRIL